MLIGNQEVNTYVTVIPKPLFRTSVTSENVRDQSVLLILPTVVKGEVFWDALYKTIPLSCGLKFTKTQFHE